MGKYGVNKQLQKSLQWFIFGYYLEHIASAILIYKIHKQRSVYGVSIDSQVCLLFATLARCIWFSDTQLNSLTLAYVELALAIGLHSYIVYLCYKLKDNLYTEPPKYLRFYSLVGVAFVLSMIFHPGDKHKTYFFTQQMFVSFTMFCEALSLSP